MGVRSDVRQKTQELPGLKIERRFTKEGVDPFDQVEWSLRTATIRRPDGSVLFEQKNVEAPRVWSDTAVNIVASKYFRGALDTPERETSVKQLISRVVGRIVSWGVEENYFTTDVGVSSNSFAQELTYLLVHQMVAFNSPVWFNLGVEGAKNQASACYINAIEDKMESIMELATTEALIFKWGSGAGVNLSPLRSSKESLSGGGIASGPVSFMKGYDAFSGVIKSGGKLRRAAKIVILNVDHPDIVDFVECKAREERKAHALIDAGYDPAIDGEAYASIFFQNSNNSVRVTDEFMKAVEKDETWELKAVTTGETIETLPAKELMDKICESTWQCGDPGLQYDTTINDWHTCPESGRINASNPCNEFAFLDNSACNLASFNLLKYVDQASNFRIEDFCHSVDLMITAMEIIVGQADYPTATITQNSCDFRPLGLGYANLGALLMSLGLPYDSKPGRAYAGALTALMHGRAYRQSAIISRDATGPFAKYEENLETMLRVIDKHSNAVNTIDEALVPLDLMKSVKTTYAELTTLGLAYGFRNAQVTVLAPTGTISFMLGCDTTGIEPAIALVSYKKLVGGGQIKLINEQVPAALRKLKYPEEEVSDIYTYLEEKDTIEGAPHLKEEHLAVFDCALKPANGKRYISSMGHIQMMAAAQPFLSGAISKTVNIPEDATVDDIKKAYTWAWEFGLKAIAIYRDGCKRTQPLNTSKDTVMQVDVAPAAPPTAVRHRLTNTRQSLTHKFEVGNHEGYLTVGYYENGDPGEIFINIAKEGSTISGLMDSLAISVSIGLQHGVPLDAFNRKFAHASFEPHGFTPNPEIRHASSVVDYIFRWLDLNHNNVDTPTQPEISVGTTDADAPPCHGCGNIMVRNGNCHSCRVCGSTSGCS
jgi:ribonucleoside-diphosphate reductase alpha chain